VVKPGDVVKVKVLEVDKARKRISLTMRMDDAAPAPRKAASADGKAGLKPAARAPKDKGGPAPQAQPSGALAEALRRAGAKSSGGTRK
jgi:uncharacterized protein